MQSGALASAVLAFARSRAIGVSTLVTMGNESMISTADVLGYLVDDEQTRVICLFLEEITEPDRFAGAAKAAAEAGKPVVVLKHMLGELRGSPLLRGARGTRPADLDALARVVETVGDAALSVPNGSLREQEVEELWVNGDQVEALDVLVITDGS